VAVLVGASLRKKAAAAVGAALLVLCLAGPARAEEPKFGGCLASHPGTCFTPAVSVNVLAMSIRDGKLTSTFDPGIGYGVSFFSDRWHKIGLTGTASFPTYEGERRIEPALMASFAEYVRIGFSCPLYVGALKDNARVLLGFGADFGRW
jgi:hypothetical protein